MTGTDSSGCGLVIARDGSVCVSSVSSETTMITSAEEEDAFTLNAGGADGGHPDGPSSNVMVRLGRPR